MASTIAIFIKINFYSSNSTINLTKVTRCSDRGSRAADALSKADFREFRTEMPGMNMDPGKIPRSFLMWVQDPKEDLQLGHNILKEISGYHQVLGYNC